MANELEMMEAIERDQAWLGRVAPPAPRIALERIKHRVRIEVDQAWIERETPTDPSFGNLGAIKAAMREEMGRAAQTGAARAVPGWGWRRRMAALATAAVIVFACGVTLWWPAKSADTSLVATTHVDDWVEAMALDATDVSQVTAELASLRVEIVSLESSLTADEPFTWVEGELEDVGDELEVLITEIG